MDFADAASVCAAFCLQPRQVMTLQRQAEQRYTHYLDLWRNLQEFRQAFTGLLSSHGITLDLVVGNSVAPFEHTCSLCSRGFDSFHGLTSHLHQIHGISNLARRYAAGVTCRCCLVMYHDRPGLVHHWKHLLTGCLISLVQSVPPLAVEEQLQLDQADPGLATEVSFPTHTSLVLCVHPCGNSFRSSLCLQVLMCPRVTWIFGCMRLRPCCKKKI